MNITPWMKQYYDLKEVYKDSILFFRMGDFYEMFWEDAHTAHKVLWINITTRNKNAEKPEPLAGFPYHAKEKYLPILVNAWYKVAIAEQISDPKLKWIVKREVVRVVTPSTLWLESENYSTNNQSYILSIISDKKWFWLSYLEPNNWRWYSCQIDNIDKLLLEIFKINPLEIVLDNTTFDNQIINEYIEKKLSCTISISKINKDFYNNLISHFWIKNLNCFWLENKIIAQKSSSVLLEYLSNNQKTDMSYLDKIIYIENNEYMQLDESTIRSLDIIYNFNSNSKYQWTLLWIINNCKTSMWSRYLENQIIRPLQNIKQINSRLDFINELLNNKQLLDIIIIKLKNISDLDNILVRLSLWRTTAKDLLNLKNSLIKIIEIYDEIKEKWSIKLNNFLSI